MNFIYDIYCVYYYVDVYSILISCLFYDLFELDLQVAMDNQKT
jgi:hypothetical protein